MVNLKEKKLYLHLGTYKTATTFLQQVLWQSFKNPRGAIYYPKRGLHGNAHHYLATDNFPAWNNGGSRAEYENTWKRFLKDIHCSKADSIIFSSEMLCSISMDQICYIRKMLANYPLRAIIYLRRQDQYISSLAAQLVKACNGNPQFYTCIDKAIRHVSVSKSFDYEIMCDQWAHVIGRDNLIVRPFEKTQLHEGDILKDFFYYLLNKPVPESVVFPSENVNPRLCRDALEFKQLVNRLPTDRETMNATLPALFDYSRIVEAGTENAYHEHVMLSPSQRMEIFQRFKESNARIAREYIGRRDGILFEESMPVSVDPWIPYPGLNGEKILDIIDFIGKRNPGVVELLSRAADEADRTDKDLQWLSIKLKQYVQRKKSIVSIIPTFLLRSYPSRRFGMALTRIRQKKVF